MAESPKNLTHNAVSYPRRPQRLKAERLLRGTILYAGLGLLIALGYALLVAGLSMFVGFALWRENLWLSGFLFFILALVFYPLRNRLEMLIDRLFMRGNQVYQDFLARASSEFAHAVDIATIVEVLSANLQETLRPVRVHIFTYDSLSDQYAAKTSDLRFHPTSALVQMLTSQNSRLVISGDQPYPDELRTDKTRLQILDLNVFAPLTGRQRLLGWVGIAARSYEDAYTTREFAYLTALCDQAALAIERAQILSDMEKQVREMNVLTRVAQGVNITVVLDDIFELIYAQTTQIIPVDEFRIILKSSPSDDLRQVFYIRKDERVSADENLHLPPENSLEVEVVRQGHAILSDDYSRDCRQRGLLPLTKDIFAWIGAPLNAGAESIGLISLARFDPVFCYSQEHMSTMQAITDQAAGAIIKARLLAETDRRARQLKSLNEVTRQLTSTLDPERLLKNILQSAVEILNCEAGSLLMVDEQTDELVFRVVLGPVADELVGHRMASNAGIVGRCFQSQEPMIVNDVRNSGDWFDRTDQETGFRTRSLLVAPLLVKEQVIGVLEVLNREDGSNFTLDDQELLGAFASQAAIAIENARLYTLTDQALAARVEELSVMQRIDRELNTSLDIGRAMHITLDWAMRQSNADSGLVAMIAGQDVRLMASQGYNGELAVFSDALIPADRIHLNQVIEAGEVLRLYPQQDDEGLLGGAKSQVFIPIQREKDVIGLILLESRQSEVCSQEALDFLQRLGDHAAIAIANAQLYNVIETANVAKSEFVSFVAHELKNPMTSIKGYTELLVAKAVGPVNDAQANFLAVIRANVDRMNTLVSDLNDLSKIEAGRLRLDFAAVNLGEVIQEVERSTRRQFEEKEQHLVINLPAALPLIWCDQMRLLQILVNLVNNANKYTEQGGEIVIGAVQTNKEWSNEGSEQVVHVWVKDTGIGISPEDQTKIFQKYFRSDDPKTREVPGSGLGLNITRSLVEMQGGQIWFESEYRQGTTFHFTVPIAEQ
jgi:signal transduction histidine kinase/putative methionine-R-sulfoxide reductase with GAF domain